MAIISTKKTRKSNGVNLAAVATMPAFRTRDDARAVANRMRDRGVTPTTPEKRQDGWHVGIKHNDGKMTLKLKK